MRYLNDPDHLLANEMAGSSLCLNKKILIDTR